MADLIQNRSDIRLNRPVLVAAFRGWNDAGDAASFAATHLGRVWAAEPIASIDPEEFYDFQDVRPTVELVDGVTRKISWPTNEFSAARLPTGHRDVILLVGTEPNMRWRTFASLVVELAQKHHVEFVVTLGALLADVPHSRPVPITGTAVSDELIQRLGLHRSRYEGPTGIVGVLHDAFSKAGIDSASLWAAVPHYLAVSPNPKAALALVDKATDLIGVPVDISDLERATAAYESRVADMVAGDDDVGAYVRMLEERTDEEETETAELPSGDALAAELEKFLRERDEN
ncbi:MAG TPA: PAC2 family protein [Actinomycetota bacterium]|nr:PAC2 family protein [Actinomycetota bacterium]